MHHPSCERVPFAWVTADDVHTIKVIFLTSAKISGNEDIKLAGQISSLNQFDVCYKREKKLWYQQLLLAFCVNTLALGLLALSVICYLNC